MTPIVHITDKEQALQRENANMLDTINKQAASIEKLRKVVEMKDLTIEAQTAEIAALKAQPVQEPVAWIVDGGKKNGILVYPHEYEHELIALKIMCKPLYAAPVAQPEPQPVKQARQRKPQPLSRCLGGAKTLPFTIQQVENRMDSICGCKGVYDCNCTEISNKAVSQLWYEHNTGGEKKP